MPNNPIVDAIQQTLMNMGQNERNLGQGVAPPPMYNRPEVNLDPIRIIKSLMGGPGGQGGIQQPQAPMMSQPPMPPMNIASPIENVGLAGQQEKPQGNGINWQMLMDIGIPALSAIIGTAAPGTLAGAAGLSTGYTGAREKQREQQREEEIKFKEKEEKDIEEKKKEIKRRAEKIVEVASETFKNPEEVLKEIEMLEDKLDIPRTKTGESLKSGKIRVRDLKSGQTGTIDSNEFDFSLYEKL